MLFIDAALEQAQAIIEVQKKLSELLVPVASWSRRHG
jgi:hypothetical protein